MNICNEPKFSFSSKDKTIYRILGNSLESYNLPNNSNRFVSDKDVSIRLEKYVEKEITPKRTISK
jgi:hypothetical protein